MTKINPKNMTAQLSYRAVGNPPSTVPDTAISNCFPGLEFDFRNIWRRLFVGLTMHEARPIVLAVDEGTNAALRGLEGALMIAVEGQELWVQAIGPQIENGPNVALQWTNLEWANALAGVVHRSAGVVRCSFQLASGNMVEHDIELRPVFDPAEGEGNVTLNRELLAPGELTQSLCSPWQNDYKECACYYWAASRPDFVNSKQDNNGKTVGHNWLHKGRDTNTAPDYSLRENDLVSYEDLYRDWEQELKFIIGGKDEDT